MSKPIDSLLCRFWPSERSTFTGRGPLYRVSNQFICFKSAWALSHEFKLMPFSSCSCVIRNEWRQLHFVLFIFVEHFCMRDEFWVEMYHETRRLVLKIWDEWYNKWMITQGARTPCFLGILTPVFLSYLKTNFRLKCLQPGWLAFHFSRNVTILQFLFFLIETDDRN